MRSVFRFEKKEGGVYRDTFANIVKQDTFIVKRTVTDEELMKLTELAPNEDISLDAKQE